MFHESLESTYTVSKRQKIQKAQNCYATSCPAKLLTGYELMRMPLKLLKYESQVVADKLRMSHVSSLGNDAQMTGDQIDKHGNWRKLREAKELEEEEAVASFVEDKVENHEGFSYPLIIALHVK